MVFQSIVNWPNNAVKCLITQAEFTYENGNLASRQAAEGLLLAHQGAAIQNAITAGFILPAHDRSNLTVMQARYAAYLASL